MDMKLRGLLLRLLDDLSDLHRCRLHFILGNEIPRRLRELNTIESTIQVFEHLIENEKIFTSLITALSACGKPNWSRRLKEFEQVSSISMTHSPQEIPNPGTITELTLADLSDEEEDSGLS